MHAHLKEHVATLREQVLMLKNELFVHANCGCWEIDRYLERVAGEMIGRGMGEAVGIGVEETFDFRREFEDGGKNGEMEMEMEMGMEGGEYMGD